MKSKQKSQVHQIRSYLDNVLPEGSLELIADDLSKVDEILPGIEGYALNDEEVDLARKAIFKIARNEELQDEDLILHEAIIMVQLRPVIDIINNSYTAPSGHWKHLDNPNTKELIKKAIPSVGRIELPNDPLYPFIGTGFVVGPDLLMTNRHVAELFCSGLGIRGLKFQPGKISGIDFRGEKDDSKSMYIDIREVIMIHPYWDMALLRINSLPVDQKPLCLSLMDPEEMDGREVVVIGYPGFDQRNNVDVQNRIFRGIFGVKRLQPGTLTGRKTIPSFKNLVYALKHNASTLGGNSGSAIVDIKTGEVVGLHFAGTYLDSNYAVPPYELARDSRVIDSEIVFCKKPSETTTTPWEPIWRKADPQDMI